MRSATPPGAGRSRSATPSASYPRPWSALQLSSAAREEQPGAETGNEDERQQDEGQGPGPGVIGGIRRLGQLEDGQRDREERLAWVPGHRVGNDRSREQERRRLPGRPGNGEHRPGQDSANAGGEPDSEDGPPPARAEGERPLPKRWRHEREHLLSRPGDKRQHDDRERERALPAGLSSP